jgi:hypothetical protein
VNVIATLVELAAPVRVEIERHPVLELHERLNERTAQLVAAVGRIEQLTGEPAELPAGVFTLRRLRALEDVLDRARVYLRSGSDADRAALAAACERAGRQP